MALPPCLVAKTKGTGEAEIQRVVGGTAATIVGSSWGVSTLETPSAYISVAHNRVLSFTDGELYAVIKNSIRKNINGTWTEQQAGGFTVGGAFDSLIAGLYTLDNGGVPTMVVLGRSATSNNARTEVSTDGTTWTGTNYVGLNNPGRVGSAIAFRNSIFWGTDVAAAHVVQYDVVSDSFTAYAGINLSVGNNGSFCVLANTLYFAAYDNTQTNLVKRPALYRFQGGAWAFVQDIGGGTVVNGVTNQLQTKVAHGLYERDGNLYALVCGADSSNGLNPGVYHYKLVPNGATFTETDITVATLPTSIRSASAGGSANSPFRISTIRDNDTAPATPAYYFQMLTDDSGGTTAYWVHGGDDATLFSDGSSSTNVAWPEMGEGGGERFFTSGGPSIYCTDMAKNTGAGGGMKLTLHGRGGQTGKTVEIYLNADEEAPDTLATLVAGTATGGSATNTTALISSVDLDGTAYTVIVNTAAASLANGDKAAVAAFVAS